MEVGRDFLLGLKRNFGLFNQSLIYQIMEEWN